VGAGGVTIDLGGGTFLLSAPIAVGGEGFTLSGGTLLADAESNGWPPGACLLNVVGSQNIAFAALTLDGAHVACGARFDNVVQVDFSGVFVLHYKDTGIHGDDQRGASHELMVSDCFFAEYMWGERGFDDIGVLQAVAIYLEPQFYDSNFYNSIIGTHGIVMVVAMIIVVTGPLGNFIMPLMVGARDMAFPRLNALSFWLLFAAVPPLVATLFMGGIRDGWSAYQPLATQAGMGMVGYQVLIIVFGFSTGVASLNLITTAVTMRARGMNWSRVPIFVIGIIASSIMGLVWFPMFQYSQVFALSDRVIATSPLLEAVGNAQTVMNNNSSRYGKYLMLQFDLSGKIMGASIKTYLLEKTRVVRQSKGERNYHVFYLLTQGAASLAGLLRGCGSCYCCYCCFCL
jgi:hypothetical protein